MKTELLAPAGDIEAGYAALFYGADAVYLGLQQFRRGQRQPISAKKTLMNLSVMRITWDARCMRRSIRWCRKRTFRFAEKSGYLFALQSGCGYLQDLGVARIIRESYPELEMHASTQMAVHNKEGALALQRKGSAGWW